MARFWNRRQFLLSTGAAASAAVAGRSLLSPRKVSATTYTRKDVGGLTATSPEIVSYATAVTAMQALPATNPLSWAYQAAIHFTTLPCPCPVYWNQCQHGTEFFWSWHRMYLYYFERIVRAMSGDSSWALPYWNWQLATEATIPPMFRDTTSVLYTSHRNASMNATPPTGSLPGWAVDCSAAMGDLDFASAVEDIQTPHGNVHVQVGGWMAVIATAAMDPIFYFHHSNVDRLWDIWLAQGGGREDPTTDTTWTGKTFTFFDETGSPVTLSDCDVLRAAQQLNYEYEGEPTQVNDYCFEILRLPPWVLEILQIIQLPGPPVEVVNEPFTLTLEFGDELQRIQDIAASSEHKLLLELGEITASTQPGVSYQVYVGLPQGQVPEPEGIYFVGSFSLFGPGVKDEVHHGSTSASFRFQVNHAVNAALRAKRAVDLTIVPAGILVDGKPEMPHTKATLHIGAIGMAEGTEKRSQSSQAVSGN